MKTLGSNIFKYRTATHRISYACWFNAFFWRGHFWWYKKIQWKEHKEDKRDFSAVQGLARPSFLPLGVGNPSGIYAPLCQLLTPACLLADTGNNADIWPVSKLITPLGGIDPSSRGYPSRALCFCSLYPLTWNSLTLHVAQSLPHGCFYWLLVDLITEETEGNTFF